MSTEVWEIRARVYRVHSTVLHTVTLVCVSSTTTSRTLVACFPIIRSHQHWLPRPGELGSKESRGWLAILPCILCHGNGSKVEIKLNKFVCYSKCNILPLINLFCAQTGNVSHNFAWKVVSV